MWCYINIVESTAIINDECDVIWRKTQIKNSLWKESSVQIKEIKYSSGGLKQIISFIKFVWKAGRNL